MLKTQVLAISNNLVANYPELKPLFNGINPNDILKINTNDLDKLLTNKQFSWENNDFGLASFHAKQAPYSVTDWYNLTANLTLDFTCLDENAKVNTSSITQSYDMYFANDGANLNQVVTVITSNIEEKLKVIKAVKVEYEKWNDSFVNQQQDVLTKINDDLKQNLSITNLTIDTQAIDNPLDNDYNSLDNIKFNSSTGMKVNFPLILEYSQKYVNTITSFNSAWKDVIAKRESAFVNKLNAWKTNNGLTISNLDNVFVFNDYKTTNWKISGLEIKSISVPYYITSKNTTRASNTTESLTILEKLFVGSNSLFKYEKNWNRYANSGDCGFSIKPDAFDKFVQKDVKVQEIYDYVTKQTINFGKDKFIKDDDRVEWTTSLNTIYLNKSISSFLSRYGNKYNNDSISWRLVINGNAFGMPIDYINSPYKDSKFWFLRGGTQYGI